MTKEYSAAAKDLAAQGVRGVHLTWADNNGIPRSRIVPIEAFATAATAGVGVTNLFAVFDTHDRITFAHSGLSTPAGDIRIVPVFERLRRLEGQPALAWAPVTQLSYDGSPWPYCQRSVLQRQVARAARQGLRMWAGYEIEFTVAPRGSTDIVSAPGHGGPAYSPHALVDLDEFVAALLRDFEANGLTIGQLHTEFGLAQIEVALAPTDPVSAADDQLLARQTIHAAARAHGLRVSFSPVVSMSAAGNGWHLHSSVWSSGTNLLAADGAGSAAATTVPSGAGASYLAGLLRELPALSAVGAPSAVSAMRLRPGHFASAYTCWGVQNREAPLRYVPGSALLGAEHANVELKPSDASANPYLALAAVLAAGAAGIEDGLVAPEPLSEDPGTWTQARRREHGLEHLPVTHEARDAALLASDVVGEVLGPELFDAFRAVRASDAAWAAERDPGEVITAHLWRY